MRVVSHSFIETSYKKTHFGIDLTLGSQSIVFPCGLRVKPAEKGTIVPEATVRRCCRVGG